MIVALFLVSAVTSAVGYLLLSGRVARKERSVAVRRLTGKDSAKAASRTGGPALIEVNTRVRGPLATRLLNRLELKSGAERLLETAGLKWGAAGLAHRAVIFFIMGFAAVT